MPKSAQEIQKNVRQVLRTWNKEHSNDDFLSYLYLFQQRLRQGSDSTAHQIAKDIISDALHILEQEQSDGCQIVQQHYQKDELITKIANNMGLAEGTVFNKQREAITRLADIIYDLECIAQKDIHQIVVQRLGLPANNHLVGIEEYSGLLLQHVLSEDAPWLIAVVGMGGIGKTSLASAVIHQLIEQNLLMDIGWITAKQTVFNLGGSIDLIEKPALTADELIVSLGEQLMQDVFDPNNTSAKEILPGLRKLLKEYPHLIVVDNLETVTDLNALLSILRDLANPSKFLLTSRMSLFAEPDIFHFAVLEMNEEHALALIRYEAKQRNLPDLLAADRRELMPILETVGGNPLALRLVVGQIHTHTLDSVLEKLQMARGRKSDNLYTYIYRDAWDQLDEMARHVLLLMPLITNHGETSEYIAKICKLDLDDLDDALGTLIQLSLVESRGDLHQRRYTIHGLTRTFLQKQVIKWQSSVR